MPLAAVSVIDELSAAMSTKSLQNQVIASNIANRDSEGYQRLRLQFSNAMDRAGQLEVRPDPAGNSVPLEQDLIALSANAGQYAACARVLNRYFSILSTITTSGRT